MVKAYYEIFDKHGYRQETIYLCYKCGMFLKSFDASGHRHVSDFEPKCVMPDRDLLYLLEQYRGCVAYTPSGHYYVDDLISEEQNV